MLRMTCLGLLSLSFCLASTARGDDAAKAQKLIDRAIKGMGGSKSLKKLEFVELHDSGIYYGMGDGIPYKGVMNSAGKDRFRVEIVGVFVIVANGDKGWVSTMGMTVELNEEQIEEQKKQMQTSYVTSLIPLEEPSKKFELSLAGEEEIDGQVCDGINVNSKGERAVKLVFSRKTGLLTRAEYVLRSEEHNNQEVLEQVNYGKYAEVDGVVWPHKLVLIRDGKKFVESNIEKVSFPESANDSLFVKP